MLFIIIVIFTSYLLIALISFNESDPSWLQTGFSNDHIHNLCGSIGAYLADTLLFVFGVIAFAIPIIIISLYWTILRCRIYQGYIYYFIISLRLIGILDLVITTCGIAEFSIKDICCFNSGGIIGYLVYHAMAMLFNSILNLIILLLLWMLGITLYIGHSWLIIAEKIGILATSIINNISSNLLDIKNMIDYNKTKNSK